MRVQVSSNGQSATVTTGSHTTQIVGLDDARRWIGFYEKMDARYSRYGYVLALFRQAAILMEEAQGRAA